MPFNPVPLCLEAVARLLSFPVPLRLGTYGKGCKWMSVVCLWLALSPVLQNTNASQQLRWFPVPQLIWRGVARVVNDCAPCAFGSLLHPVLPHLECHGDGWCADARCAFLLRAGGCCAFSLLRVWRCRARVANRCSPCGAGPRNLWCTRIAHRYDG